MAPVRGVRTSPTSHVALERAATRARSQLWPDIGRTAPLTTDIVRRFEALAGRVINCHEGKLCVDVDVRANLGYGVEGVTSVTKDRLTIALSEDSYRMLECGHGRSLFTLAHELGHAYLHPALLMRAAAMPHVYGLARGGDHKHYEDTEWQANAFAASLIAPAAALELLSRQGDLSASSIERIFGLSQVAAEIRLKTFSERRGALLSAGGG